MGTKTITTQETVTRQETVMKCDFCGLTEEELDDAEFVSIVIDPEAINMSDVPISSRYDEHKVVATWNGHVCEYCAEALGLKDES